MFFDLAKALTSEILHVPNAVKDDGTPDPGYGPKAYRWRLKMATVTSVTFFAVALHMANVYGVIGEGFASAKDVKDIRSGQLEPRIEKYQTALCMNPGQQELLDLLRELQRQYKEITGHNYETPSCDVLFKSK